ncbi:MAG: hypothetical protein Q9165_004428 [Trypethelium subeluteriae]
MSAKAIRRLATDHKSLHNEGLPPYYLFPPNADAFPDDLTQLDVLLAGPHGTAYADGLWRLHLDMPKDYPTAPPKAFFETKIWHPNVEEASGSVCVDTLKRDWESKLTLRDVLITISCLLIHPNPASALNAEAGALLQDDFSTFSRRAKLMTSIHAKVPEDLCKAVAEARSRGEEEVAPQYLQGTFDSPRLPTPPPSSAGSGLGIQGCSFSELHRTENDESKENDSSCSPARSPSVYYLISPRRQGTGVPLGELDISHDLDTQPSDTNLDVMDADSSFSSEQNVKNNLPTRNRNLPSHFSIIENSATRSHQPLFGGSNLRSSRSHLTTGSSSIRTNSSRQSTTSPLKATGLTPHLSSFGSVSKPRAMSPAKSPWRDFLATKTTLKKSANGEFVVDEEASRKRRAAEDRLWKLAGEDIHRYNRGDFGPKKTAFDRI